MHTSSDEIPLDLRGTSFDPADIFDIDLGHFGASCCGGSDAAISLPQPQPQPTPPSDALCVVGRTQDIVKSNRHCDGTSTSVATAWSCTMLDFTPIAAELG